MWQTYKIFIQYYCRKYSRQNIFYKKQIKDVFCMNQNNGYNCNDNHCDRQCFTNHCERGPQGLDT